MPTSNSVKQMWNEWSPKDGKRITKHWLRAEQIAEEQILPSLDFEYIIRFSNLPLRRGTQYRLFAFDIYAERGDEKWLIDITTVAIKVLEVSMMVVLKRMGVTNFGAICINKSLSKYVFKEAEIKEHQQTISIQVTKDDYVWGNVKEIP